MMASLCLGGVLQHLNFLDAKHNYDSAFQQLRIAGRARPWPLGVSRRALERLPLRILEFADTFGSNAMKRKTWSEK
jgi:hypothetical protein